MEMKPLFQLSQHIGGLAELKPKKEEKFIVLTASADPNVETSSINPYLNLDQ
jgi:hypothetical protein